MNFYILASGYNCESYARACYESIDNQSYTNFIAVLIDDGSTDETIEVLKSCSFDDRIVVSRFDDNVGRCKRIYDVIKNNKISDEDVIICLGMDDRLTPVALEKIKEQYDTGAWFTYGNWQDQFGRVNKIKDIPLEVSIDRSYRRSAWITTAPQTFKKFLFNAVTEKDLQYANGKWLETCTDLALTFPLLEQCPIERIHKISDPIYIYNMNRKESTLIRLGKAYKTIAREHLKTMPIKPIYV